MALQPGGRSEKVYADYLWLAAAMGNPRSASMYDTSLSARDDPALPMAYWARTNDLPGALPGLGDPLIVTCMSRCHALPRWAFALGQGKPDDTRAVRSWGRWRSVNTLKVLKQKSRGDVYMRWSLGLHAILFEAAALSAVISPPDERRTET